MRIAASLLVVASACVAADAPELATSESTLWQVDADGDPLTWSSGVTSNLSPWRSLDCYTRYGADSLLTGLHAFREPSTNLDNFIARLDGTCTGYVNYGDDFLQDDDSARTVNIFTEKHRTAGNAAAEVPVDRYPNGLVLLLGGGSKYVSALRIETLAETAPGVLDEAEWTDFVPGVIGSGGVEILMCRDDEVISGVRLRHDISNGKIRRLEITCRELLYTP